MRKFGAISEEVKSRIMDADSDSLEFIADHIFDLASLDEVLKYLPATKNPAAG